MRGIIKPLLVALENFEYIKIVTKRASAEIGNKKNG